MCCAHYLCIPQLFIFDKPEFKSLDPNSSQVKSEWEIKNFDRVRMILWSSSFSPYTPQCFVFPMYFLF